MGIGVGARHVLVFVFALGASAADPDRGLAEGGARRGSGQSPGVGDEQWRDESSAVSIVKPGRFRGTDRLLGVLVLGEIHAAILMTQTNRDRDLVRWISRIGAVAIGHVEERLGVGRSVAYDVVARLASAGLLERVSLLRAEPSLIRATDEGNYYAATGLTTARITPALLTHWVACADVGIWAERRWGPGAVTYERELRLMEQIEGKPVASAVVGRRPDGASQLHRPDLAVSGESERPIAIEVELTPKAPARLRRIMRGWRKARNVERVIYLAAPGETRRAVDRAIRLEHADGRVQVVDLRREER